MPDTSMAGLRSTADLPGLGCKVRAMGGRPRLHAWIAMWGGGRVRKLTPSGRGSASPRTRPAGRNRRNTGRLSPAGRAGSSGPVTRQESDLSPGLCGGSWPTWRGPGPAANGRCPVLGV